MQIKYFAIPASDPRESEIELNAFLRSHRVLTVRNELVTSQGQAPFWAVAVEFLESGPKPSGKASLPKVDYKEVLSEAEFEVYRRLRDLRKQVAEAEGRPVYNVFSNEQLAKMVQQKVDSKAGLLKIEGVGEGKVERYGEQFLAALKEARDETGE